MYGTASPVHAVNTSVYGALPEKAVGIMQARTGLYRDTSDQGIGDMAILARGGKLIGHRNYGDDVDFDLTPSDCKRRC